MAQGFLRFWVLGFSGLGFFEVEGLGFRVLGLWGSRVGGFGAIFLLRFTDSLQPPALC